MPSRVFKDISKLSPRYVPERLPHREGQVSEIVAFFPPNIYHSIILQIEGPAGSGKTCSAYHAGKLVEKRSYGKIKCAYINLKLESPTKFVFYKKLVEKIAPEAASRSVSAEEILGNMLRVLTSKGLRALLIVDEIDYFLRTCRDSSVIYELTRLNELMLGEDERIVGVIFIARESSWKKSLDVAELSTLGNMIMKFPKYSAQEIYDILEYRASEALYKTAYTSEILEYIADVTAEEADSDVRFALDVLCYSGLLAEREGASEISPEHVRKVLSQVTSSFTMEDLYSLSQQERVILLAVAYALKDKKAAYVSFSDVIKHYKLLCERYSLKTLRIRRIEDYLQRLEDRGILDFRGIKRIGISGVSLEKLIPVLDGIIDRLSTLFPRDYK